RDRPVSRSFTIWADTTVPCLANSARRSSSVVPKGRLPTYKFFMLFLCGLYQSPQFAKPRHRRPEAKAGTEDRTTRSPGRSWIGWTQLPAAVAAQSHMRGTPSSDRAFSEL